MEMTFRWYGKDYDKIKLADIRQIPGMKGIVGTLLICLLGQFGRKNGSRRSWKKSKQLAFP